MISSANTPILSFPIYLSDKINTTKIGMNNYKVIHFLFLSFFILSGCNPVNLPLGEHEAIRTYTEFADGSNRGMYDPETESKGYPDEDFDATTAMVINWHRMPENDINRNARLSYRMAFPEKSDWKQAQGETYEFWYRDEKINRVILKNLAPGSIYEYKVKENGKIFRFRTMPASLEDRPVRIIMTADHQTASWNQIAHDNAKMAAIQKPDMFIVVGDFVNDEGEVTSENAQRWARYLDYLYDVEDGYFFYDKEVDGQIYENLVIPHVSVLGNHETGKRNHIRWPSDLYSPSGPQYPEFVAANWAELLFHWPYKSEGFYNEFGPNHPNLDIESAQEGFGKGGFGKLSFSDYLLFIGLDNSQNWEGEPDRGLKDRDGNLITDKWPWFETHYADVRQDKWLENLLEPENGPAAGDVFTHIIPVWHRGLFGTGRLNMSLKNRNLLKYWLPILHRNGVKLIKEAHDHNFTRTVPLTITSQQPENTYLEKVYYDPHTWELTDNLSQEYIDEFYAVNCLIDKDNDEIIGWEYDGNYVTHDYEGMITIGHGGWAAGRRDPGQWGGGNAGLWFVNEEKGGVTFGGEESFHITTVHLTDKDLTVEAFHPEQLSNFENDTNPVPIHRFRWDIEKNRWLTFDVENEKWPERN